MLNPEERAEREGLLGVIAALLEDRLYDHELRKLLANVAIDRHIMLHMNANHKDGEAPPTGEKLKQIASFTTCTNNFCVNVNKQLREFKRPEFKTNQLIVQSMQLKYEVEFIEAEGALTVKLKPRGEKRSSIIIPGSEVTQ